MGSSIGGSTAQSTSGALTVDARNYGLSPTNPDNSQAIQAAHDALAAAIGSSGASGVVRIPAAATPYAIKQSIWMDRNNIAIEGEAGASISVASGSSVVAPFILGLRRVGPSGQTITSAYRPDVFGVLDSTAASGPGQRWGFRTNFDGYMLGQGTSLTHVYGSDCYKSVSTLTIDLAYRIFTRTNNNWVFLAGMGNSDRGQGSPWMVQVQPGGVFQFTFGTQAALFATPQFPFASFTVPGGDSGLHRVSIQVDLTVPGVTAWADGKQLAVSLVLAPAAGGHFCENQHEPFLVGVTPAPQPNFSVADNDFALYGLKVSKALIYTPGAIGSTQHRADGRTITDQLSYFPYFFNTTDDPDPVGNFPFTENPNATTTAGVGNTRIIGVRKNSATPYGGGILLGRVGADPGGIGPFAIRGLGINGGGQGYGIAIGMVLGTTIEDVYVGGGQPYSIGNLCYGANYPVAVRRATIDNSVDSGFYFNETIANLEDINLENSGRTPFRFVQSNVDIRNATLGHMQGTWEAFVKIISGAYGGDYRIRNVLVDAEGPVVLRSFCYAERTAYAGQATLRCEDWYVGTGSDGVPLFDLHDAFPGVGIGGPLRLLASNIQTNGPSVLISVDGPNTVGTLSECSAARPKASVRTLGTYGPAVNVNVIDDKLCGPPRSGAYPVAGVSRFALRQVPDGQYSEWRVVGAGTVNSAAPPRFAGLNLLRSSAMVAAGHAYDHSVFSSSILGGTALGSWYDPSLNGPVTAMFGGASYTPPATINLDLFVGWINRDQVGLNRVSGNGYATVALANNLTNFPAASGGVKSLGVGQSYPVPTGDQGTVVGLGAFNGPTPIAFAQLATPVDVNVATGAISLPASAGFAITHTPTNINGYLTTYGWSRLVDCVFGGQALGAPSTWCLGLSTTPANLAGTVTEPSGNNYSRTAITNDSSHWYGPASLVDSYGGVVANAQAVTVPTPSGAWGTITTLFLADAATGGHVWAILDLVTPVAPTSGNPPTIAAGALHLSLV